MQRSSLHTHDSRANTKSVSCCPSIYGISDQAQCIHSFSYFFLSQNPTDAQIKQCLFVNEFFLCLFCFCFSWLISGSNLVMETLSTFAHWLIKFQSSQADWSVYVQELFDLRSHDLGVSVQFLNFNFSQASMFTCTQAMMLKVKKG